LDTQSSQISDTFHTEIRELWTD